MQTQLTTVRPMAEWVWPAAPWVLPVALALGNQNVFTAPDEDARGQIILDTWMESTQDAFVLTQGGQEGTRGISDRFR